MKFVQSGSTSSLQGSILYLDLLRQQENQSHGSRNRRKQQDERCFDGKEEKVDLTCPLEQDVSSVDSGSRWACLT